MDKDNNPNDVSTSAINIANIHQKMFKNPDDSDDEDMDDIMLSPAMDPYTDRVKKKNKTQPDDSSYIS